MNSPRTYGIVGGAFGLGSRRKETAQAPQALRMHNLLPRLQALGVDVKDFGDVAGPEGTPAVGDAHLKYLPEIKAFGQMFYSTVVAVVQEGRIPVVLGGDHSISVASVAGVVHAIRMKEGREPELGLLWVDAHGDVNTPESTPSGNAHGMPVASLCGFGHETLTHVGGFAPKIDPTHVAFVGLRDLDPPEKVFIKTHKMNAFTMSDVDVAGIGSVVRRALDIVSRCRDGFVVSFDLDVCDPAIAPGVGTPVRGGLSFRESHCVMEMIAQTPGVRAIELVEYNPACDVSGATAEMGVALLESALGKTIL